MSRQGLRVHTSDSGQRSVDIRELIRLEMPDAMARLEGRKKMKYFLLCECCGEDAVEAVSDSTVHRWCSVCNEVMPFSGP